MQRYTDHNIIIRDSAMGTYIILTQSILRTIMDVYQMMYVHMRRCMWGWGGGETYHTNTTNVFTMATSIVA